jgi:hypothetical protein
MLELRDAAWIIAARRQEKETPAQKLNGSGFVAFFIGNDFAMFNLAFELAQNSARYSLAG